MMRCASEISMMRFTRADKVSSHNVIDLDFMRTFFSSLFCENASSHKITNLHFMRTFSSRPTEKFKNFLVYRKFFPFSFMTNLKLVMICETNFPKTWRVANGRFEN